MTLFSDRWLLLLPVAIGVQQTEVPNLGVISDAFFLIGGYWCYQLVIGVIHTGAKSGSELFAFFDGCCDDYGLGREG